MNKWASLFILGGLCVFLGIGCKSTHPLTIDQLANVSIPDPSGIGQSQSLSIETRPGYYAVGDINNDRAGDLVTTISYSMGGTGFFTDIVVFLNVDGQPLYASRENIGDRIMVNSLSLENGIITAAIITQGPGEPMCCGTTPKTLRYKFDGTHLVEMP